MKYPKKQCAACARSYIPTSKHKLCPACRNKRLVFQSKVCPQCTQTYMPTSQHALCPKCRLLAFKRTTPVCRQCKLPYVPTSIRRLCDTCRSTAYKHPCKLCGKPIKKSSSMCRLCYRAQHTNSINASLRCKIGSTYTNARGYVFEYTATGYRRQHMLVMEQQLGRPLLTHERVHHVNGIKNDNSIKNLELWTRAHPSGIRAKDAVKWANSIIATYSEDYPQLEINVPAEIYSASKVSDGARYYNHNGYIVICTTDRAITQHRLIMEQHLQRRLLKHEHVHHLNGIRDDNRLTNLELWTRPHPSGARVVDVLRWAYTINAAYKHL